jgi:hypothetical protein
MTMQEVEDILGPKYAEFPHADGKEERTIRWWLSHEALVIVTFEHGKVIEKDVSKGVPRPGPSFPHP